MPKFRVNVDSGIEVMRADGQRLVAECYSEVELSAEEAAPFLESGRLVSIEPPVVPAAPVPDAGDEDD